RGKDHDAPFLEMPNRSAPDVRFGQLFHPDGGHDPRVDALALEDVLHGERVDHGAEHAHVVGGDAIEAGFGEERAADDVAAADHESDTCAGLRNGNDFIGEAADDVEVVAEAFVAGEGFS